MTEPNAAQSDFWNSGPGRNWVRHQTELDANHAEITDHLIAACAVRPGEHVLDVGCGAGGSTFRLAEAAGERGDVLGLDISAPLLELAEQRRASLGLRTVSFARMDAQTDPMVPASRDLVASRFGMMFFADPVAAFRNLGSALRPGGRMVFVAWAAAELNPWFAIPQAAAVARLGLADAGDPHAPGPMAFSDAQRVLGLLAEAGLRDGRAEAVDAHIVNEGGLDAIEALCAEIGPLPRMMRDRGGSAADKAAILARIREGFTPYASAAGVRVPARVILYSARI